MVQWVDMHADSKQLRIQDQLSIPWQRLMRYRLLLKGILRHSEPTGYDTAHRNTIINQKKCVKQMVDASQEFRLISLSHISVFQLQSSAS